MGTPYTIILGRNLYTTFMNAYSLVSIQVRRKLDEMLKTWKEPVPGSLDTKPVFPPETIKPIESALLKARTAALQQQQQYQNRAQQEMMRGRPQATPNTQWRHTPTPPQAHGVYYPPPQQGYPQAQRSVPMPNGHFQVGENATICKVMLLKSREATFTLSSTISIRTSTAAPTALPTARLPAALSATCGLSPTYATFSESRLVEERYCRSNWED